MKKNHFYWLGFLVLLVQLGWSWEEVWSYQGPTWEPSVLSHSVTIYSERALGLNGGPILLGLLVKRG